MKIYEILLAFVSLIGSSSALTSNTNIRRSSHVRTSSRLKKKARTSTIQPVEQKKKCVACPEPELDLDMDRREATFALLGQIWATAGVATTMFSSPPEAEAIYGADANIAIPNMMEGIENRVNKQCLVESLGNRECLVYLDPDKKIYKGADAEILLSRLEKATASLADIPDLVSQKKWSKVNSVLTGPMGSLGGTMSQLAALSENEEQLSALAKNVKNDLYAIVAAADRKNGDQILKLHEKATNDLVAYAKALS